ncbi:MAG: metallophosphoesterase family protein, partial [Mycobacteriales bacterium]
RGSAVLAALVISDIHFIRHKRLPTDVDAELRNGLLRFLPAVKERFPDLSVVLVCGDVAYHAVDSEYAAATGFLREVQAALGGARVLVIPGNHDIDRTRTTSPDQRNWRSEPRKSGLTPDERDQALTELLEHERSGPGLFEPLTSFNRFASAYGCEVSPSDPCWRVELPIHDRYTAEIRGLTSVLISDAYDDDDRLLLGDIQVADMAERPGVLNITLCHHPYTWLLDGERQKARISHRSVVHITGHEHQHEILVSDQWSSIHLCTGALQPTRDSTWAPRLYAIGVDVVEGSEGTTAQIEIVGARWDRAADQFIVDTDEAYDVPIEVPAEALTSIAEPQPSAAIARLIERIAALQSSDRITVAANIEADLGELARAPVYEFPRLLVDYGRERNLLHELCDEVKAMHGGQSGEANPFPEQA